MQIDVDKSYDLFASKFNIKSASKDWHVFDCPFCGRKKKCAVNFEYCICKCWVCGYKNGIAKFLNDALSVTFKDAYSLLGRKNDSVSSKEISKIKSYKPNTINCIQLPRGYMPLMTEDCFFGERARNYLLGRGFDLDYLDYIGVGYVPDMEDEYFGYVIIPFTRNQQRVYFNARTFMGSIPKYKNPPTLSTKIKKTEILWNQDCLDVYEKIYITEGTFSSLAIGDNSVAIMGKTISGVQRDMIINSACNEVVVTLDAGYEKESLQVAFTLCEHKKVKVLKLEGGDPNEIGRQAVLDIESQTDYFTFESLFNPIT